MFRATDLGFLYGENVFRAAELVASMEDASFGWPFCGSSVEAAGSGGWNARALWGIWGVSLFFPERETGGQCANIDQRHENRCCSRGECVGEFDDSSGNARK